MQSKYPEKPPLPLDPIKEISALIQTLHATERRLEEVTGGEIDSLTHSDGEPFMLRRARGQLRANEIAKQSAILDALPAQIALLDMQGIIVSVNDAWHRFAVSNSTLGRQANVGADYLAIRDGLNGFDLSLAEQVSEGIRSVLFRGAKAFSMEYPNHTSTEQRWFLLIVAPLAPDHPSGAVVMHVDLTAKKQAEERVRTSESRFRQIADNIRDVFFLQNLDASKIYYVSPAYERIWGRTCESLYADPSTWAQSIHPDDLNDAFTHVSELQVSEFDYEFRIIRPDGVIRWIQVRGFPILDIAGKPYRTAGIASDVTQRKQALEELHESERRFSDLLRNVDLVSVMLDRKARITYCNEYLLQLSGWQLDQVIGKDWFDLFTQLTSNEAEPLFADLLANKPETWHRESEICTRSREARLIRWNNSVLRSGDGEAIGTASIGEDITEQRRVEVRLKRLNRVHSMLSAINSLIVRVIDRDVLFNEACRIAVEEGGLRMSMIGTLESGSKRIVTAGSASDSHETLAAMKEHLGSIDLAANALVMRALTEKIVVVADDSEDHLSGLLGKWYDAAGMHSLAVLPLMVAEESVGVLMLFAGETEFFHEEEVKLLTALAGNVAFAIDHIQKAEKLDYVAYHDELTGLPNRRLLHELLRQSITGAVAQERKLALVLVDIERFKTINDTLGWAAGDALLKEVATRLLGYEAVTGRIGRVDADHFAVIIPDVRTEEALAQRVELRIKEIFGKPFLIGESELRMSVKIGIAMCPTDGVDAEMLFRNAEAALNNAKTVGNKYLFYTQAMNERVAEKLALENQLRQAIENHEFVLFYQPKVDLKTGRIAGLEALLRWQRPGHEPLPPQHFIHALEDTGLILEVGNWVIEAACRQMDQWMRSSIGSVQVSVNVSSRQFIEGDLDAAVIKALKDNDIPADQFELELTESSLMADTQRTITILQNVKRLGVEISVDDFGTGYSSLAYLRSFPLDKLKIDIAFIRNVTSDPGAASIVQAIIRMAHSLKLEVIAEGVETLAQLRYLRREGCDYIQGYYFSQPLPASEIEKMLREQRCLPNPDDEADARLETLLLVDDDEGVLSALQRLLRRDGYRILVAQSAAAGFEVLALYPVQVILCDQRMPDMSGTEFFDRVKELYPSTLRIILSGFTDLDSILAAINQGAIYRFYTKPWENKALRENIREAFRNYHLLRANSGVHEMAGAGISPPA
jgi:diguanylate cyclase (GGDEF)-like protein/PAS domain S-box-containing protein